MKKSSNPYVTVEQLEQIPADKYVEAAKAPKGPERDALLAAARNLEDCARVKNWVLHELQKFPSRMYH